MQLNVRALPVLALLLLAGCSSSPTTSNFATGPTLPQPNSALAAQPVTITPAALPTTTALQPTTVAQTDVSSFVDGGVLAQLSANDKSQAASAQFNSLTFGRPGAPRSWTGDKGVTGSVIVGPYVTVNNIICRDFTHTVTVSGTPYVRKGTACKDATNTWSVAG